MKKHELKSEILRLKSEKKIAILAHTYCVPDVIDVADITGDSFLLAQKGKEIEAEKILLCGVRFMAETVKILSPEKTVMLSHKKATCPMALQIEPQRVIDFKHENPHVGICTYVNSTAELKAVSDVCVTSSSAVRIAEKMPCDDILFIPDQNLGRHVASLVPSKNIILWNGCCPIHHAVTEKDILDLKEKYPAAKVAIHPECRENVLNHADFIGSTSAIIEFAENENGDVIIGTERGVVDRLQLLHPERNFVQVNADKLTCENMKLTSLQNVYDTLSGKLVEIIDMSEELRLAALKPLDEMLRLGQ